MARNHYTTRAARAAGYRSGFEQNFAKALESIGVYYEFETEACKFSYTTPIRSGKCTSCDGGDVVQWHTYTCDFYIPAFNIFIETKGRFLPKDRTKHEILKRAFPDTDLRLLFERDAKATPNRSYSDWCNWKGITYGIVPQKKTKTMEGNYIPHDWLEELTR